LWGLMLKQADAETLVTIILSRNHYTGLLMHYVNSLSHHTKRFSICTQSMIRILFIVILIIIIYK